MKKFILAAAAGLAATAMLSAPATAAVTYIGGTNPCTLGDVAGAIACAGFYSKNSLAGTNDAADNRQDAFTRLGLSGTPMIIDSVDIAENDNTGVIDFGQLLFGNTVISIHWGGGNGGPPNTAKGGVSGMYVFNFATSTASITTLFGGPLSNARLFSTGSDPCANPMTPGCGGGGNSVPEPGTWALMIVGFGSAGAMLRRRRALVA